MASLTGIEQIALPVPFLGTVNVWLLRGEPLTLIDTGAGNAATLAALELALAGHGVALEDIELLLLTHHHLDHSGLAETIRERSGGLVAALAETAAWGEAYHDRLAEERDFTLSLMRDHGVPRQLIGGSEPFWEYITSNASGYATDRILADGDVIDAGGRRLRVIHRPGHSTTDTLYVDDAAALAFVGDHVLAQITSGAELVPRTLPGGDRRRGLLEYLANLRLTAAMPLQWCLTGHGPLVDDHRRLIEKRFAFHNRRLELIAGGIEASGSTTFGLARTLFGDEIAGSQTVLAIWEILGHLDLLVANGAVEEHVDGDGRHLFLPLRAGRLAATGN